MALKKQNFAEGEIAIFDEAFVYKRGEYWQFRLWLPKENKYARISLPKRRESVAIECGKALKKVMRLCKGFGFTDGMLKDSLAEGRKES